MAEGDVGLNLDDLRIGPSKRGLTRLPTLIRRSLRLVHGAAPRDLYVTASIQLVTAIALAFQVLITRELLTTLFEGQDADGFRRAIPLIVLLTAVTSTVTVLGLVRGAREQIMGELVGRFALDQVLESATHADLMDFENPEFHNRLVRAQANASMRPLQMVSGALGIISAAIASIGLAIALLVIAPLFTVLIVVGYTPLLLATRKTTRLGYGFSKEQAERDRRRGYLGSLLTDRNSSAEVRAYGLGSVFRGRWQVLSDQRVADLRAVNKKRLFWGLIGSMSTAAINSGALILLVWFVTVDRIALADAGAAATGMILLSQRLRGVAGSTNSLYESSLFLEDFTQFVDEQSRAHQVRLARSTSVPGSFQRLEVRNLSFRYPNRDERALDDVSFDVRRGEVIALVGENGSGKTTLTKLLAGLYEPPPGTVFWDGVDITTVDPSTMHPHVGVIFQGYAKYMLSVRENVSLGDAQRPEQVEEIERSARSAGIDDAMRQLRNGYETQLGSQYYGGSDLSIGQWQRLALARAFYRDAPFLILDEPSASLDPRSERELFDQLSNLYRGKTVLVVTHRFSTVRSADRILVLNEGRLVEQGPHEELMASGGLYAELFTLQASAFLDT